MILVSILNIEIVSLIDKLSVKLDDQEGFNEVLFSFPEQDI